MRTRRSSPHSSRRIARNRRRNQRNRRPLDAASLRSLVAPSRETRPFSLGADFEFEQCDFSRKKMSNSGSARVALHHLGLCPRRAPSKDDDNDRAAPTRWPRCRAFTLECNYNRGHAVDAAALALQPPRSKRRAAPPDGGTYSPKTWRDVGRGLALAFADVAAHALKVDPHPVDESRRWLLKHRPRPSSSGAAPPQDANGGKKKKDANANAAPSKKKAAAATHAKRAPAAEKKDAFAALLVS